MLSNKNQQPAAAAAAPSPKDILAPLAIPILDIYLGEMWVKSKIKKNC